MNPLKEKAKFKWRSILSHYIDPKLLDGNHRACPICGGRDRFRFDDRDGDGSYYCNGPDCGPGSGVHLLAMSQKINHSDAWRLVEKVIGNATEIRQKKDADRIDRIKKVLAVAHHVTPCGEVSTYLRNRGLSIPVPDGLLEAQCSGGDTMMVGKFAHGQKLRGIHVTFIRNGRKIENGTAKKMFGVERGSLNGSAIRLSPLGTGSRIIVTEGIETGLACMEVMPGIPVWATGSAGLMEALDVPQQITEVIICGDNDNSFTGQAASYKLAYRLKAQKKDVQVLLPPTPGIDWLDQLVLDKQPK